MWHIADRGWPRRGYLIFGNTQPDPSEEIDAIIEKTKEEAEADKQAALEEAQSTAEKVAKEKPEVETFVTTYFEFPGTFTTNLRSCANSRSLPWCVHTI